MKHLMTLAVLLCGLSTSVAYAASAPKGLYYQCELTENYSVEINLKSNKAYFYDNYGDPSELVLAQKTKIKEGRKESVAHFFEGPDLNNENLPLQLFFHQKSKFAKLSYIQMSGETIQRELLGEGTCLVLKKPLWFLYL